MATVTADGERGIGPAGSAAALAAQQQLVEAEPRNRVAWHNLGVELRQLGRGDEALSALDRAWALGLQGAETATMRGHVLADLGQLDAAIAAYRNAVAQRPDLIEAQQGLANLLPQVGRAGEALDGIRDAIEAAPDLGVVWVTAMELAKGQQEYAQLLAWAHAAQDRFGADTLITTHIARAFSGMGRDVHARDVLLPAIAAEPDFAPAHNTLAHVLLRLGDPAGAAAAAEQAAQLMPEDQSGWALLGVAWRLLDDPREDWLCGYDRLVIPIDLPLDAALGDALTARHFAQSHPADQSLRGGTQTRGNLFASGDPQITHLARAIADRLDTVLAALPMDPSHPFLGRNTARMRFAGAWSVRLANAGFHISHIHPAGWLSSALYVSLPPSVRAETGEGALTFGVPDAALGLDLAPRRVIHPREGQLVVFPSYLWHGTTPFADPAPRLTVAFDALPLV